MQSFTFAALYRLLKHIYNSNMSTMNAIVYVYSIQIKLYSSQMQSAIHMFTSHIKARDDITSGDLCKAKIVEKTVEKVIYLLLY